MRRIGVCESGVIPFLQPFCKAFGIVFTIPFERSTHPTMFKLQEMLKAKLVHSLAAQTATGLLQRVIAWFSLLWESHIASTLLCTSLGVSSHMLDLELPGQVRGMGQQESSKSQHGQMPSPAPGKENMLCNNPGQWLTDWQGRSSAKITRSQQSALAAQKASSMLVCTKRSTASRIILFFLGFVRPHLECCVQF